MNIIFKCRFKFKKPKKAEILLYDQGLLFNKDFKKNFQGFNIEILYVRFEEINIYVLLRSLKSFKSFDKIKLFFNYLITYCNIVKPTWVISCNHFDLRFYDLKNNIDTNVKFAIVQNFAIFNNHIKNFFDKNLKNNKKFIIDYFFCFDDSSVKILKKYIVCNFVIIGSFRNNCYPLRNNAENMDILVISGFKEKSLKHRENYEPDLEYEKKLVQSLFLISKKKNLKFKILLKPFTTIKDYTKF